ncbi:MAG: autotransporter domain-containing protein [Neisseriaceae bacterium]
MKKTLLAFVTTVCLNSSATFGATLNPFAVAWNILGNLQVKLDNLAAGIIEPYDHEFPKEDLLQTRSGYEFNNLIILGDSLSDAGSDNRLGVYIAGGYESPQYLEYLSLALTGKHSAPFSHGGLNYGLHGATMVRLAKDRKPIEEQYLDLLKRFNNKIPTNSPAVLWGGNMDLNHPLTSEPLTILSMLTGQYSLDAPDYTLNSAPYKTAEIVQDLLKHGVPYVFVPNIADGTVFPYSTMVFTEIIATVPATQLLRPLPYTWYIELQGRRVDDYLRDPQHIIPGEGAEFFRANHINAMQKTIWWFVPQPVIAFMYDLMTNIQRKSILQYNRSLDKSLGGIKGNVVYFDFKALMEEVAYHYQDYGFVQALVPTCTIGYSSRSCDIGSPHYHNEISLFSDWFHPSPQLHLILAQAMLSIFNAPVYASSIVRQAEHINIAKEFFINNQLSTLRKQLPHELHQLTSFVGYSGSMQNSGVYVPHNRTYTHTLNMGVYTYLSPQWLLGTALSVGFGTNRPHPNFHYGYQAQSISLFSQYLLSDRAWFTLNTGVSRLNAENISRSTLLYQKMLTHLGRTKVYSYNVLARLGANLSKTSNSQLGPIIQLGFNHFKVQGYQETGKSFLAMHYKKYHYDKNYIGLGWSYEPAPIKIASKPVKLGLEVSLNRRLGHARLEIPASLTTAPVTFNREIQGYAKKWLDTQLAAEAELSPSTHLNIQLGLSSDFKRQHSVQYSLGFRHQF